MVTVLEEYTTEDERSVVLFMWEEGLKAKDIRKEMFPVYGGKCLSRKAAKNSLKYVRKLQMMPDQMRKRPRQQSKDFSEAGFQRTGKAMGQVYQYWWKICREIHDFFFRFEYHMC
jgi:hypothetical protein